MTINRRAATCFFLAFLLVLIATFEFTQSRGSILQAAVDARTRLGETIAKSKVLKDLSTKGENQQKSKSEINTDDAANPSDIHAQSSQYCKWGFSHYESSAYELEWLGMVRKVQNHVCETVMETHHAEKSKQIVQTVLDQMAIRKDIRWRVVDSQLPSTIPSEFELFSRMHYSRQCYDESTGKYTPSSGHGIQLIEPLWGMLRDPFDVHCNYTRIVGKELVLANVSILQGQRLDDSVLKGWRYGSGHGQSKQHIMPQGFSPYYYNISAKLSKDDTTASLSTLSPWRSHGVPPWFSSLIPKQDPDMGTIYTSPRNVHIDIGSSYFGGWDHLEEAPIEAGFEIDISAAGSGKWFYENFHVRGQPFDKFVAIELEPLNVTRVFRSLPQDLVGKYTFMNLGLTMNDDDHLNAIDLIKRLVRPEDFLVLKLDIDSAPIELPIVNSLLKDDPRHGGASALVDELMFEHRKRLCRDVLEVMLIPNTDVNYFPMNLPWETKHLKEDLADSYKLFKDLRSKGIRAHSWP